MCRYRWRKLQGFFRDSRNVAHDDTTALSQLQVNTIEPRWNVNYARIKIDRSTVEFLKMKSESTYCHELEAQLTNLLKVEIP